jgi:3,4-dihydroxy-9,10-secoandrosta-1,3,5(10)-triene-9,17-dione 4,5-dioxygenase
VPIRSLGYVSFETPAFERWDEFGSEFLGLMRVDGPSAHCLYYRMDEYPQRFMVKAGDQFRLSALGFEVANHRDMTELAASVKASGVDIIPLSDRESEERRITGGIRFADPGGNMTEVFYGPILDHVPVQTPGVSRFVTGDMGMGHAIISAADPNKLVTFYTEVLGFWERNTMRLPDGGLWFLSCNSRHHTVGVMPGPGPALMHWMVETATIDDVGLAIDRANRLGVPFMNSLGRHTNDQMVSFYVYSPEMCAVEVGWSGIRVDGEQPTYEITKGAYWGHKFFPPPRV